MRPAVLAAYQILQVAPWATIEEVKRAYRARAKDYHPDLHDADVRLAQEMIRLNRAHEVVVEVA